MHNSSLKNKIFCVKHKLQTVKNNLISIKKNQDLQYEIYQKTKEERYFSIFLPIILYI